MSFLAISCLRAQSLLKESLPRILCSVGNSEHIALLLSGFPGILIQELSLCKNSVTWYTVFTHFHDKLLNIVISRFIKDVIDLISSSLTSWLLLKSFCSCDPKLEVDGLLEKDKCLLKKNYLPVNVKGIYRKMLHRLHY